MSLNLSKFESKRAQRFPLFEIIRATKKFNRFHQAFHIYASILKKMEIFTGKIRILGFWLMSFYKRFIHPQDFEGAYFCT